jgi:peptidoglycan/xylan/chitin deacetylase (PgdA/CDA1 family)
MKPVLMIHEITDQLFDYPLENYILTFDDGLYSQYYYYDKFKEIDTQKIFFISSNIICKDNQSIEFPSCNLAHQKAFSGNTEDYMTVSQIKDLMNDPLVSIGGHSHYHKNLSAERSVEKIKHLINDTKLMIGWFENNLGFSPTKFCFPYNNDYNGVYRGILHNYGIREFYGKERIAA